jgi:hypothetical protein
MLGPLNNQLNRMNELASDGAPKKRRGIAGAVGLGAALSLAAAQQADAATELAQVAAGDSRWVPPGRLFDCLTGRERGACVPGAGPSVPENRAPGMSVPCPRAPPTPDARPPRRPPPAAWAPSPCCSCPPSGGWRSTSWAP